MAIVGEFILAVVGAWLFGLTVTEIDLGDEGVIFLMILGIILMSVGAALFFSNPYVVHVITIWNAQGS